MRNIKDYTQFSLNEEDYTLKRNIFLKDLLKAGGISEVSFSAFKEAIDYAWFVETNGGRTVPISGVYADENDSVVGLYGSNGEDFTFFEEDNADVQIDPETGGFLPVEEKGSKVLITTDSGFRGSYDARSFFEVHDIDIPEKLRERLDRMDRTQSLFRR